MKPLLTAPIVAFGAWLFAGSRQARADYPKPSPYPISWELNFQHDKPQRIVVDTGEAPAKAYWYMTYTVTNNSGQERTYLPSFELVTKEGKVVRSDRLIPAAVFDAIKKREKKAMLEPFTKVGGEILLGEDQSRDGVAIWEEPTPRMGNFAIYANNLSGEAVQLKDDKGEVMKDPDGKPIILRKTLQLNYVIHG